MKTTSTPQSKAPTGPAHWRSLDQLADTPEFRQWVDNEFPAGASEFTDPVSRRKFVKLMSASFLLAGLGMTGCRRPEETILPFSNQPEGYVHGVPKYFATAMPTRTGAVPLLARWNDGRPTKVEGNPDHPDSNGATDSFAQASVLDLYDPDRSARYAENGGGISRTAALKRLGEIAGEAREAQGRGLHILAEPGASPTRDRLQGELLKQLPEAKWYTYDALGLEVHQKAASKAFGRAVKPYYKFDKAKVIVSLDCDFLGSEEDSQIHIRRFAQGRRIEDEAAPGMNRLYSVEALFTLTGAAADHRLRVPASAVQQAAAQLGAHALAQVDLPASAANEISRAFNAQGASVDAKWISECANDLVAHKGECLVVAGHRQPEAVHLIALAINAALGNIGTTLELLEVPDSGDAGTLGELTEALNDEQVDTLVVLGGNPVYNAPADLEFGEALARVKKRVVRLGSYEDESFPASRGLHLPQTHYLEAWGDARTADGTLVPVQPLVRPLLRGISEIEVLARLAGAVAVKGHDLVRTTFAKLTGGGEPAWRKFLHDGFLAGSAHAPTGAELQWAAVAEALNASKASPVPTAGSFEVVFYRDAKVDDGRYNNNGWLQETPDPITKLTWDNAILLSPGTARELGLRNIEAYENGSHDRALGDFQDGEHNRTHKGKFHPEVLEVTLDGRTVRGPAWVVPGMADNVLGMALGYGRHYGDRGVGGTGRVGAGAGFDACAIRTSPAPFIAGGARITRTGEHYQLASTQEHGSMDGRPLIREANLADFLGEMKDFASGMGLPHPPSTEPLYPNPLDEAKKAATHQWGMSIDLNTCVGCNACVLACQSENNVPIVGKEQVTLGREMHWIRMDRYFSGDVNDPQMAHQPMFCQHCEAAPCESVCPVNATVHDEEGLNLMVYNRCVGTRYCSNNCPYKVRRFNFFDYNRRPLDRLYESPITSKTRGEWELKRWFRDRSTGAQDPESWELLKLVKNPNVSVRMRGVMEKCTYCVQRIEEAKINRKVAARDTDNVEVRDGEVKTACQQACPADSIVFGNIADPESRVSKLKRSRRDYSVLDYLATKPRTTYLARLRNPNPRMPDYRAIPNTMKEWQDKGNHLHSSHGGGHSHEEGAHHEAHGAGNGGHH